MAKFKCYFNRLLTTIEANNEVEAKEKVKKLWGISDRGANNIIVQMLPPEDKSPE